MSQGIAGKEQHVVPDEGQLDMAPDSPFSDPASTSSTPPAAESHVLEDTVGKEPFFLGGPDLAQEARRDTQEWLNMAQMRPATSGFSYLGLALALILAIALLTVCAFAAPAFLAPATHVNAANPGSSTTAQANAPTSSAATPTPVNRLDFPTQAPDPTPLPYTYATPTLETTITPAPADTPTPINGPEPTVPPPGGPGNGDPPILFVSPTSIVVACQLRQNRTLFLISNLGGSTMNWNVDAGALLVEPRNGSLAPGERAFVTIRSVTHGGQITIKAANADNSPQTIVVSCG